MRERGIEVDFVLGHRKLRALGLSVNFQPLREWDVTGTCLGLTAWKFLYSGLSGGKLLPFSAKHGGRFYAGEVVVTEVVPGGPPHVSHQPQGITFTLRGGGELVEKGRWVDRLADLGHVREFVDLTLLREQCERVAGIDTCYPPDRPLYDRMAAAGDRLYGHCGTVAYVVQRRARGSGLLRPGRWRAVALQRTPRGEGSVRGEPGYPATPSAPAGQGAQ